MPPRDIAIRLTTSYESLMTTVSDWSLVCKQIICYEHPEPQNIHCHLLLTGVYCTDQHLKDIMWGHGVTCKGAGQLSFKASFKTPEKKVLEITEESYPKYITYMSKGKYEPKYNKGFSDGKVESYKLAWIVYTREPESIQILHEFEKFVENETELNLKNIIHCAHVFMMGKYKSHTPQMRKAQSTLIDDYCYYHMIQKEYRLPYQPY